MRLLYNGYTYEHADMVSFDYVIRDNSLQTGHSFVANGMRGISTTSRFCYLEEVDDASAVKYIRLTTTRFSRMVQNKGKTNKRRSKK